ncbi:MAG TPA: isocitrate lyase/phosphoenolpyruvate mutase family protein [Verrucomicrobiota bacterium]|nr:isocitrate lyase/phosphoenolpyruvate mutase family protein [Verrucomicrobiota bacterium]HNT15690.1 isocitrate lyase/phosphoenolpyruvate mutase family protein [Verrucomicrobiota bacterium]
MNLAEQRARAAKLRELHRGPKILVLPNAWDCLSARLLGQAGFPALATTSGGVAAVLGYPDGQRISAGEMLLMVGRIAATVALPVTADLEAGYHKQPAAVAGLIRQAISLGLAGANLEDGRGPHQPLADPVRQAEVIQAVRATVRAARTDFVLNARVDVFLHGGGSATARFREAVRRAHAYGEAGADCIFPIGLRDRETIARLVREVSAPVNILAGPGTPPLGELEQLGVRRVTFGSGLLRATLPDMQRMFQDLRARGDSGLLAQTVFTHATMNALFP